MRRFAGHKSCAIFLADKLTMTMIDFDSKARQWDSNPEFVERGHKIAEAIRARVPLAARMRALDVGCGSGLLSVPLARQLGHITCIDTSPGMLEVLNEKIAAQGLSNLTTRLHDLAINDLPQAGFDLIMSSMTLHHIVDTDAILARFAAHLRPGGWLCLADLDREDGSFHGKDVHVHHGFDRQSLGQRALRAGFTDVRFETVFVIRKEQEGGLRDYPVFLLTARKA